MMNAICVLSVIPVRKEPSDKSEQVTQLLFGETVEIIDKKDNWQKIRTSYDEYTGWVDVKQIAAISEEEFHEINSAPTVMSADLVQLAIWNKSQICPIVIGSSLPRYSDRKFNVSGIEFQFDGNVLKPEKPDLSRCIESAYLYMNAPYLWGGRSPFGIDCSGFTQMVYKLCGVKLKRDAYQQAEQGTTVNLLEESKPGDLAFFDNAEGKITHVGMLLSDDQIMHASGKVRIDNIDHQGIFNSFSKSYSHNLRLIKRIS